MYPNNMVGLEAEFLLVGEDGNPVVVPTYIGRDSFPLLGEVRGDPGKTIAEVLGNFWKAYYDTMDSVPSYLAPTFTPFTVVGREIYREAIKQSGPKKVSDVKNVYGDDLAGFSDLIIKDGKITGAKVSCGLHVHFSSNVTKTLTHRDGEYKPVDIPLSMMEGHEVNLSLYRKAGYAPEKEVSCTISALTKPAIHSLVKAMDEKFAHLMPIKEKQTKYRRVGYFELKPWGFEYRSLPTTCDKDILLEVVKFAFSLLGDLYYPEVPEREAA